jgi:ABC-type oligopeptide transport system ATPase subunit
MNITFYDKETNGDLNFLIKIYKNGEIKVLLNDEIFDLYNNSNEKILNFKHNIILDRTNFYLNIDDNNIYLEKAIEYLYFKKFNRNINKLIKFISIIDSSIVDIIHKDFYDKKQMERLSVTSLVREYSFQKERIPLNKLSTGTKIFIVYVHLILTNDFIIIDELDASLHLRLTELLIEIAKENNIQFLFSTHNPLLIQECIKKYELYIMELDSKKQLELKKANKLFKSRDNLINSYLLNSVSSISDNDIDDLIELFNE